MSNHLPPDDSDKTLIMPTPGGRRTPSTATPPGAAPQSPPTVVPPARPAAGAPPRPAAAQTPPSQPGNYGVSATQRLHGTGVNPLVNSASSLLALLSHLRTLVNHDNVPALRHQVINEIRAFETTCRNFAIDPKISYNARYLLSAAIDETVLYTVWGNASIWSRQSLLSSLHNETSGGKKFFDILDHLMKDSRGDLNLLELMYILLSLGFQGRYRIEQGGAERLEDVRHALFEHIRQRRGEFNLELSPHWQPAADQRKALRNYVPLWVLAAVAGAILLSVFTGFSLMLENSTAPTLEKLEAIGQPTTQQPPTLES